MVLISRLGLSVTASTGNCTISITNYSCSNVLAKSKPLQKQLWQLSRILSYTEDKAAAVVLFYAMQFNVFLLKITDWHFKVIYVMPTWACEFMYLLSSFLGLYFRPFSILIWFFMKNYSTVRTESVPRF